MSLRDEHTRLRVHYRNLGGFVRRCSKCEKMKNITGGKKIGGWLGKFVCADCKSR